MATATSPLHERVIAQPAPVRVGVGSPALKFRPPRLGDQSVRRAGLLSRLERGQARPLVLVTAPAGYGKTTLLDQWAQDSGSPAAWVTLDGDDGAPEVLAASIARALAGIGIESRSSRSFVLVLDDAHHVPPRVLGAAVLGLLGWLPQGSQLAIASRTDGLLTLSRWRAQRMLVEIRAEDLAMSVSEAASLLRQDGLNPDSPALQTLVERTEGWPVALGLAAIPWGLGSESPDVADQLVSEYLREELLAELSPAIVRFLTCGSVLDRLSGPLCDAVLERRRSGLLLAELARANVLLSPADAAHESYRLHGLFREMLQTELRRTEPELEAELHRRAAAWHLRAGDVTRAVQHARCADDFRLAGELMWRELPRYIGAGQNEIVQDWLRGVSAERAAGCAPLALAAAHSSLARGSGADAEQWARVAGVALDALPEERTRAERAGVLMIEAWTARSGVSAMQSASARAFELLANDSPWRASCCLLRGTAALLAGDRAHAEEFLQDGAARGTVSAPDAASLCLAQLSVLAAERGELEAATDYARRARSIVDEHGLGGYPMTALVSAVDATSSLREGRVDEAKAATGQCLARLDRLDDSLCWFGAEVRILAGQVLLGLGDVARARELLADASRLARRAREVIIFQDWFDHAWEQFDIRAETALAGAATLTTAELRVLRFLPTHYSFHEIATRLHVSSNTVKTHVHAVYRKLDASCRSEAVARATEAGLLGG